ncbi:uncharacterized protein CLUP02_05765 [Colletotrichum lupini]|uniref:Secreted protein n=1 Tax=Colletotrichum lupini TaxID=145971 RepID=A0A9Q8SPN4_9PEZI|nr:uncharacterized protein CLUP02_05765 [Colletotrichum lupini]KAK1711370.1 hypothetical protein BDP67DRAFT_87045 [Colletotrichum lupini]UQC80282.1 hypothetical protein CLUP02_05765 [Colletotrichum lupini]
MLRLIAFLLLFTTRDPGCSCCLAGYVKVHSGWCLGKGFGGGFTAGCIPATLPHLRNPFWGTRLLLATIRGHLSLKAPRISLTFLMDAYCSLHAGSASLLGCRTLRSYIV